MQHTIVLVQFTTQADTKTYDQYDDLPLALDGICQIYEQNLKVQHPALTDVTYTVQHLFDFVESLHDIACFVQETVQGETVYYPQSKSWIQKALFDHLRGQAQP